jgi:hypothetical protein
MNSKVAFCRTSAPLQPIRLFRASLSRARCDDEANRRGIAAPRRAFLLPVRVDQAAAAAGQADARRSDSPPSRGGAGPNPLTPGFS